MPTSTDPAEATIPFSKAIREASAAAHSDAEGSGYLDTLLAGQLDLAGYGRLVAQHLHIYRALEGLADALADDPVAGPFVFEELRRVPCLEADLAAIHGADWEQQATALPATEAYVARLEEIGTGWAGGFVAHHYVRYLGDLSGGLFIGKEVAKIYEIDATSGTAFYRFAGIPNPVAFKNEYRHRLDDAPWDADERERITEEILVGYHHNTKVLEELGG